MRYFITNMILLGMLIYFAASIDAKAATLNDLSIYSSRAIGTNRHWSLPDGEKKQGEIGLSMELGHGKFYQKIKTKGTYTDAQFRYVNLETETGFRFWKEKIDLYLEHESEHALDFAYNNMEKFPNQNAVGIRVRLK